MTTYKNPIWVVVSTVQPILNLALFGPVINRLSGGPALGAGTGWQVLVPGLLVQLEMFATAFVGLSIIGDYNSGVLGRMQVSPVSRFALLFGRILQTVIIVIGQSVLLLGAAIVFGMRAPVAGMVLTVLLVAIQAVGITALSYALAIKVKKDVVLAPMINLIIVPLPLASGVILPLTLAPSWLRGLSRLVPFSYLVDAGREAFLGHYFANAIGQAFAVSTASALVGLIIGARAFSRSQG